MTTKVIAFPPVGVVGAMWTIDAPVDVSRSMLTGKRFVSGRGRARRVASVQVSALSKTQSGAGYSEMLIRFLNGGINLVRLSSYPINWHLQQLEMQGIRSASPMTWETNGNQMSWEHNGQPLYWFDGTVLPGVVEAQKLTVSGLPKMMLVARPGDFVELFSELGQTEGQKAQVVTEARSDIDGVATISLFDDVPDGDYPRVNIGASDSRVFEAINIPRRPQPLNGDWIYDWEFSEVFADEVGGFDEINPW